MYFFLFAQSIHLGVDYNYQGLQFSIINLVTTSASEELCWENHHINYYKIQVKHSTVDLHVYFTAYSNNKGKIFKHKTQTNKKTNEARNQPTNPPPKTSKKKSPNKNLMGIFACVFVLLILESGFWVFY